MNEKLRQEMEKVEELERKFLEAKQTMERTQSEIELCRQRLKRAEKLSSGLENEYHRWKENVEIYNQRMIQLVGDVFVAAAGISYYGPFTGNFRDQLVEQWLIKCKEVGVPCGEEFSMASVMGDPMEIQNWNLNYLPSDSVSIGNAILVKYGTRRPLMIDPQLQATKWIKKQYSEENLRKDLGPLLVVKNGDPRLSQHLERAVKDGYQLLLEDMGEQSDPLLESVLLNQTFKNNFGREVIKIGDQVLTLDPKFRIYMTTKKPNPHLLPEMFIRVTVINFTVTREGLEQQLLAEIVNIEDSAIEARKLELTEAIVRDQKEMQAIEDKILDQLVNTDGNILDDQELINFLDKSKVTSKVIQESMADNKEAQVQIQEKRALYQGVAERGSILYFVIADLAGIDPMYQYSLEYFMRLFKTIIIRSEPSDDIQVRIHTLLENCTSKIYQNVCRGLFNAHKLIFSFMIAAQILIARGEISLDEWNLFLKGVIMDGKIKQVGNPDKSLISDKAWRFILNLEPIAPQFAQFPISIVQQIAEWKGWLQEKEPQKKRLPGEWEDKLTSFQRILVFRALREEKITFLVRDFVEEKLG